MGRPKIVLPDDFSEVANLFKQKLITCTEASRKLNISRVTFMKYVS
ncbi:MAG: hypothetical protein WC964_04175 [Acholeplasmataceae bacterium]